jgi:GST-like protein
MFTLYGIKGSGSAAIEIALAIAGVESQFIEAASWKPGAGLDELKSVNPLAQIPTLLLPDGRILTESAAILIDLGLKYPKSGLLPHDEAQRAQVIRGLVYIAANCYAAVGVIDFPERFCDNPDDALRQRIISHTKHRLHGLWDTFADTFPASPWLNGDKLGALDLLTAVVSKWDGTRPHLAQSRPDFYALLGRIEADPRVAPVFANHWPPR